MDYTYANDIFRRLAPEKQNKVLSAALKEFARLGYSEANINKIAESAGISIGSLYQYFNDKQTLYMTIVNYAADTLKEVLDGILRQEDEFFSVLEKVITAIQQHGRSHGDFFRLYNEMTAENNSELAWKTAGSVEGVTAELYAGLIRKEQEEGRLAAHIDPRYAAFFMDNLFVLLQFSYSCDYYRERLKMFLGESAFEDDESLRRQLMNFIRGALGAPGEMG